MSERRCTYDECTFGETQTCILNNEPEDCPHLVLVDDSELGDLENSSADEPVLPFPRELPRFTPSGTLGVEDVRALMKSEYCQIVGVLGEPDSGKTACLVSLYLLLACNRLDGFIYGDSKSLVALDELSRGARDWQAGMPDQMTAHTMLSDERAAGFIHLKLVRKSDCSRFHLLIPDLPGEWSTSLVDRKRTDRWQFLRSAESIWIMVDGTVLVDPERRFNAIHRTNLLIDRVLALRDPDIPPVRLVVTRYDLARPTPETIKQIRERGKRRGLQIAVDPIASFSESDQVTPGAGITNLIGGTLEIVCCNDDFWPDK